MRLQVKKNPHVCSECPRYLNPQCGPSDLPEGPVDVLFISDQPGTFSSANNEPFLDHSGRIVKNAIKLLTMLKKYEHLNFRFAYAVRCAPTKEDEKPRKVELDKCGPLLRSTMRGAPPKLIVSLGATATKQLGFKQKHKELRGRVVPNPTMESTPTLVTFGERALMASPGLFTAFKLDLKNAFDHVIEGARVRRTLEEITKDYHLPKTMDEAIQVCEYITNYTRGKAAPTAWPISVDTETTSLHSELETSKIIAFCFAWDAGKSTTIIYDHPHAPPEYTARLAELTEAIGKLLSSPKPKIYHNAKFDLKFTDHRYNFKTNNVIWDTMLGEHLLDEDKKGNYGLKALTGGWLPDYCGYEDKLWTFLKEQEQGDQTARLEEEIEHLGEVLSEQHLHFIDELKAYRTAMVAHGILVLQREKEQTQYEGAYLGYLYARTGLDYLVRGWAVACEVYAAELIAWQAGDKKTRGTRPKRPLKPKRWYSKRPTKPKQLKAPKRPKDPRSKKERKVFKDAGFEKVPIDDLQVYGAVDTDVTRQLAVLQVKRIAREESKVKPLMRTHAIPATKVLGKMEYIGTRIDLTYLAHLETDLRKTVQELESEVYDMAGRTSPKGKELNLHGPDLGNVLYNWGWTHPDGDFMAPYPEREKTASGLPSRSEKTLRQFVEYEDVDKLIPTKSAFFIERWLTFSKAYKALNTFVANVRILSRRTGRLHTSFHINGTGTGRLSSSDMNLQNVPKYLAGHNIKKLFIPTTDDLVFVNADYSGAEVRVFTAYARDQKLIEALNEGLNMHSFFASKVFGEPYEDYQNRDNPDVLPNKVYRRLLDTQRNNIKRVVFGILYGAGPYKIAESINCDLPTAQGLIDMLFNMFPAIMEYIKQIDYEVDKYGWVETLFGRRRRFPLARLRRHRGKATRQARNFKIQSTSSDIVMAQLIEIDKELKHSFDGGARALLTVHDSICLEFPKKYIHQLTPFLTKYGQDRVREKYPWLPVPFVMDIECGASYGECIPVHRYIAAHPFIPKMEGVIEEREILNELRDAPYQGVA